MNEINDVRRLMDPPSGLRPDTTQAARRRLMLAAAPARGGHRWLLPLATAASAAAAVAAAAVVAAGHDHSSQPATLTAWTVSRSADHTVTVTLREYRDPQGLQRSLSAAGIPALVQYGSKPCPYPYQPIPNMSRLRQAVIEWQVPKPGILAVFTIHADAIPAGTQLDFFFSGAARSEPDRILLIPTDQPKCVKPPTPGPSPSGR